MLFDFICLSRRERREREDKHLWFFSPIVVFTWISPSQPFHQDSYLQPSAFSPALVSSPEVEGEGGKGSVKGGKEMLF